MDSAQGTKYEPIQVAHPGAIVVEYLESFGWSQADLARRTGLTPKTISEICSEKGPITPPTALAFEKVLQRPAHLWLNLQRRFDEAEARHRELERSSHWTGWAARFPLKEMKRFGFIRQGRPARSDVETLLNFLGVSSPDSWTSVWQAAEVAYRQTRKFKTSDEAISVWIRATELAAEQLQVADFDEEHLRASIPRLRLYTRERTDEILESVQSLCAAAGVAVVWVPGLRHTGISGSARWLNDKRALIALTLRYRTDDQMWFTFFHELGHVLLHKRRHDFVLDNPDENLSDRVVDPEMQQVEDEANRFASDTLIPPQALSKFIEQKQFTNDSIHKFAEQVGVGPGIVVGRLQHENVLAPHQGNALKQRLAFRIENEDDSSS